ncbi:hypothetical protein M2459_002874 [Parabacteroides sp. PF5-5]|uniref:PCMD domain-containing protein n=1 Tax=unclassified Parabacteroides TaxID=2649774 RepID=UPI002473A8E9|nr:MULTISPECIES: PCMD domain-containing protein [unclassified Parabacteroides]MDH6306160.1 hypothetical protein [Parabacteroides sp. PH5-39]MDH6317119.1 hypothetical protein [Parabacteroides sp. PF5-13]MDH6320872.1 hypothetical protein [Parabacteroides sp. PH5-13]MDH6324603.1 hypothetical protein [Parabacteroides sp. PH5-8]MDH6328346.1 hypothetical protein [Parabacteroides sp. PH5-41]
MKRRLFALLLLFPFLVSCIQDEPLSPYADIETFSLPNDVTLSDATFNQTNISIHVKKSANLTALIPTVTISEGATITPDPSIAQDFNKEVKYVVTAADGKHQREYTIQTITTSAYSYSFENWEKLDPNAIYETPVEYDSEGKRTTLWDSSNKGINIYKQNEYKRPEEFPIHKTSNMVTHGKYSAEMLTMVGPGDILGMINIPIVAGSLFMGVMDPLYALKDPLLSTRFGLPFYDKPLRMTGKYMYRAGTENYIDPNGKVLPNVKDSCAIYGVFFRVDNASMMLDGTNIRIHPNIVAMGMMSPEERAGSKGEGMVPFDITFEYKKDHIVDFERYQYKLALIFSSSFYGDRYEGTPGSHLIIDEVAVIIDEE